MPGHLTVETSSSAKKHWENTSSPPRKEKRRTPRKAFISGLFKGFGGYYSFFVAPQEKLKSAGGKSCSARTNIYSILLRGNRRLCGHSHRIATT